MEITVFRLPIANLLPAQAFRPPPTTSRGKMLRPMQPHHLQPASRQPENKNTLIPTGAKFSGCLFKSRKHHTAHHLVSPHLPTHFAGMARHQRYRLYRHYLCRHQPMGSGRIFAADIRARHAVESRRTPPPVQQSYPHQLAACYWAQPSASAIPWV